MAKKFVISIIRKIYTISGVQTLTHLEYCIHEFGLVIMTMRMNGLGWYGLGLRIGGLG